MKILARISAVNNVKYLTRLPISTIEPFLVEGMATKTMDRILDLDFTDSFQRYMFLIFVDSHS